MKHVCLIPQAGRCLGLLLAGLLLAPALLQAQLLEPKWLRSGHSDDQSWPGNVESNRAGEVAVAGLFELQLTMEGDTLQAEGDRDCFVAKYDREGELQWLRGIGSAAREQHTDVAIDEAGNVFVALKSHVVSASIDLSTTESFANDRDIVQMGPRSSLASTNERGVLVKYDSSGTFQWGFVLEGARTELAGIELDEQGNLYLGGGYRQLVANPLFSTDTTRSLNTIPDHNGSTIKPAYTSYVAQYNSETGELNWLVPIKRDNYYSINTVGEQIAESGWADAYGLHYDRERHSLFLAGNYETHANAQGSPHAELFGQLAGDPPVNTPRGFYIMEVDTQGQIVAAGGLEKPTSKLSSVDWVNMTTANGKLYIAGRGQDSLRSIDQTKTLVLPRNTVWDYQGFVIQLPSSDLTKVDHMAGLTTDRTGVTSRNVITDVAVIEDQVYLTGRFRDSVQYNHTDSAKSAFIPADPGLAAGTIQATILKVDPADLSLSSIYRSGATPGNKSYFGITATNPAHIYMSFGFQGVKKFDGTPDSLVNPSQSEWDPGLIRFSIPGAVDTVYTPDTSNTTDSTDSTVTRLPQQISAAMSLRLAPNPVQDYVRVDFNAAEASLELHDALGRRVWRQARARSGRRLDLSALPQGLYYLTLRHQHGSTTQRLLKR